MTTKHASSANSKSPSALTHGAFSTMAFLRGEDPRQFKKLVLDLTEEWSPFGRMEEETVIDLAGLIWRRRRIGRSISAQILLWRMDPSHPIYDKDRELVANLKAELSILEDNPQYAPKCLAGYTNEVRAHFEKKYPRKNYPSESAWAVAMSEELKTKIRAHVEQLEPMLDDELYPTAVTEFANVLQDDLFRKELDQLERLDSMIDRTLKRFFQLKGMKQMLVSPLLNSHVPTQKQLQTDQSATAQH